MIGIVVVSHSAALAAAAVELAVQMVPGEKPPIEVAAGTADGGLGTDATKVAEAVGRATADGGCVILMDLGSSLMSAELGVELAGVDPASARLSRGPFVEGLLAAVVTAAGGASLDAVVAEADGALGAKAAQLGDGGGEAASEADATSASSGGAGGSPAATAEPEPGGAVTADVTLVNEVGLHARPAATLVRSLAGFDADITLANATSGAGPVSAKSLMGVLSLGVAKGHVLRISATGDDAAAAVDRIRTDAEAGFGET